MSMALDRPLDDIVTENRKAKRAANSNRRKGARGAGAGGAAQQQQASAAGPQRNKYSGTRRASGPIAQAPAKQANIPTTDDRKIIVSNLPSDVNEAQIKDLFRETVGELSFVSLSYDEKSRSRGIATIMFKKIGDGTKAFKQYNTRLIDGKKPMRVEIVIDPTKAPAAPLSQRVAPAPAPQAAAAGGAVAAPAGKQGGPKGKKGPKKQKQKPATVEDLDQEMADYSAAGTAAA